MKKRVEKTYRTLDWDGLPLLSQMVIDEAIRIQQIPAPTFHEASRAAYVRSRFSDLGLAETAVDAMSNVFGVLHGIDRALPAVMLVAHTDTVFPQGTDLTTRQEGGLIYGPGLGDNSIGVAALLAVASMIKAGQPTPKRSIWFVATTREEGLGGLGGMKTAFGTLRDRLGMVINVEGLAFGHVYHAGIAVRRLHVTASAPGGHSWLHFGRQSAVHGIVRLGAAIVSLKPPESPRTTYNIGMLEGGQSINSIATQAGLWLDLRSEHPQTLETLEQQVREKAALLTDDELQFHLEVVGDRPAGRLEADHPLVQGALTALELIGVRGSLETGSTDGNVSLAADCPTVTIGITRGGNAHRLDEYIETGPVPAGLKQLITLTLAAANSTDDFIKET